MAKENNLKKKKTKQTKEPLNTKTQTKQFQKQKLNTTLISKRHWCVNCTVFSNRAFVC